MKVDNNDEILGTTMIFIAAELIEQRSAKHPVPAIRRNHIRDRVKNTNDKWVKSCNDFLLAT